MTAAMFNSENGPFGFHNDGYVYPQFIGYALRAPTVNDVYPPGTRWQDNSVNPRVIYDTTGAGVWYQASGGGENLTSLVVIGPSSLTGVTSINTAGAAATVIGTGGTGAVTIGNATGNTAVTGNVTFASALQGVVLNPATATGASPQIVNGRSFAVTFSGVNIAAGATQSFTITNSVITGAATQILYGLVGATTGAALNIQSVTNTAGQSVVVISNGTGATTSVVNITLTGRVLN